MKTKIINVLLVEDDPDDYLIIRDYLNDIRDYSYALSWAKDYAEALKAISEKSFDISLVDFRLGLQNGIELLIQIKKEYKDMPVILLTGSSDRKVDLTAMQIGASDFLMKDQIEPRILERSIRYAMEHTRLINALNELSIHDELTGLYNRREMDRIMGEELERFKRYQDPFSLIMLDIDHFKSVNDTYGHLVGDQILQQISQLLVTRVRNMDRSIRYGGEEFAIILPQTVKGKGFIAAEWLRKKVAENPFTINKDDQTQAEIFITISLGVADLPNDGDSKETLLAAADQALYQAKKQGRNRVILANNNRVKKMEKPSNNVNQYPPDGGEKNHSSVKP